MIRLLRKNGMLVGMEESYNVEGGVPRWGAIPVRDIDEPSGLSDKEVGIYIPREPQKKSLAEVCFDAWCDPEVFKWSCVCQEDWHRVAQAALDHILGGKEEAIRQVINEDIVDTKSAHSLLTQISSKILKRLREEA